MKTRLGHNGVIKKQKGDEHMDEILNFLTENPTFYFATVEGDQPRVRPFGFVMEYEGKLYFTMGDQKNVYKQLQANPNVEICTTNKDKVWIRIRGKAVFDTRDEVIAKVFEVMPILKNIYAEQASMKMTPCYLEDMEAEICSMTGGTRKIDLGK